MIEKPTILDFDECNFIGNEVSETIYRNVKTKISNMQLLEGNASYLEVIAMELAMSDKCLSDFIPNIQDIFIEEYRALDELQKHCLFLYLMTFEKEETEIAESLLWTFEEDLEDFGRELANRIKDPSLLS